MILVSPTSLFVIWRIGPDLALLSNPTTANQQLITFVPKPAHAAFVLLVLPVQWYLGVVGAPEDSNVTEITNYHVNCDQWRVIHISKEFIDMDMSL